MQHQPLQPLISFLNFAKADMSGLSCRLFPFFPLKPHLLANESSSPAVGISVKDKRPDCLRIACCEGFGLVGLDMLLRKEDPPRMAETEDCAQRACFLIAEVTVMHSVVTKATGSTAIAT